MTTTNWRRRVFKKFTLYAVTDVRSAQRSLITSIDKALHGGADIVQLRSKVVSDSVLFTMGKDIRKLTRRYKKLFFINDRPDLAAILDADGVHLGQDDLPVSVVRSFFRSCRKKMFIGKSTHSLKQAMDAQREGADYIGVGPIFATPTKEHYTPVGLRLIKQVRKHICIPFVCIGGINEHNVKDVIQAGARRIAVVRAIFGSPNPYKAAQSLKEKIALYEQ